MKNLHRRNVYKQLYHKDKRGLYGKDKFFFIKSGLLIGIAILLIISAIFIKEAGDTVNKKKDITIKAVASLIDASGEDDLENANIEGAKIIISQEMPLTYGVDVKKSDNEDNTDDNVNENGSDIYFDVLPEDMKLEILKFNSDTPKQFSIKSENPQILIYHTHTEEAYRQIAGDEYVQSGKWYTKDQTKSVVAVGEALKSALEGYGFSVLHDKTDHQPPSLSTAYSRSLVTMENYAKKYPNMKVYIDLHRDAYNDVEAGMKDFINVNGDECTRVMFVVGMGTGYTGTGFDGKPYYESNYKLAKAITDKLEGIKKGFTRPIRVKKGRYNQQVSDMCVLIEVGHNANSLQQAINSAKYIAKAISEVISISK